MAIDGPIRSLRRALPRILIALVLLAGTLAVDPGTPAFAAGQRVDVRLTDTGPWSAFLVGFDQSAAHSVTYYVRDARDHWRHIEPVLATPTAGGDGNVSWSYGTTGNTKPGTGTHYVTCSLNGQQQTASAAFTV